MALLAGLSLGELPTMAAWFLSLGQDVTDWILGLFIVSLLWCLGSVLLELTSHWMITQARLYRISERLKRRN